MTEVNIEAAVRVTRTLMEPDIGLSADDARQAPLVANLVEHLKNRRYADAWTTGNEIISAADEPDRFHSVNQVSRRIFKWLALHRSKAVASEEVGRIVEISYHLHRVACARLGEINPPEDISDLSKLNLRTAVGEICNTEQHPIVVTLVTRSYLQNLEIWLSVMRQTQRELPKILLLCLDDCSVAASEICGDLDVVIADLYSEEPIMKSGTGNSLNFIWYFKALAVFEILKQGFPVVYSDLDSFWLSDLSESLRWVQEQSDCFAMSADHMPAISLYRFSVTAGCGFLVFSGTRSSLFFARQWIKNTVLFGDDQIGYFETLRQQDTLWFPVSGDVVGYRATAFNDVEGTAVRCAIGSPKFALRGPNLDWLVGRSPRPAVYHPRWINDRQMQKSDYIERLLTA